MITDIDDSLKQQTISHVVFRDKNDREMNQEEFEDYIMNSSIEGSKSEDLESMKT